MKRRDEKREKRNNYLAAGEATNWDNHCFRMVRMSRRRRVEVEEEEISKKRFLVNNVVL